MHRIFIAVVADRADDPQWRDAVRKTKPRRFARRGFVHSRKHGFQKTPLTGLFTGSLPSFTDSILDGERRRHAPFVAPERSPGSMPGGVSSMRNLLFCVDRSREVRLGRAAGLPAAVAEWRRGAAAGQILRPGKPQVNA